jgi:opacity protein-like surface antigen
MAMRVFAFVAVLALSVLPSVASAQHSYGDGFGIGGVLLPSGSPTLVGLTRIGDSLGLEFNLELRVIDDDGRSETSLGAGVGVKRYLTDRKQFQPFVGGRFGFDHYSIDTPHGDTEDTRFGLTAVLGGEYFITRQISVEGEISFDLYFGSVELGTGTRLAALFYL